MKISFGRLSYDNLSDFEWCALKQYHDDNNKDLLLLLIQGHLELSPSVRRFLADHIAGRVSRPSSKKPSVETRNRHIVKGIFYLLEKGHKLTSGAHGDDAAKIMADRFGVTQDIALVAYRKLKHQKADIMRPGLEDVTDYNDLPLPAKPRRLPLHIRQTLAETEESILQVLNTIQEAKSNMLGTNALDGTKIKASRRKDLSFDHVEKLKAQMREELRNLLQMARQRAADDEHDSLAEKMEKEITHIP